MKEISALTLNSSEKLRKLLKEESFEAGFNLYLISGEPSSSWGELIQPGIDIIFYGFKKNDFELEELITFLRTNQIDISVIVCVASNLEFSEIDAIRSGADGFISEKDPKRIKTEILRVLTLKDNKHLLFTETQENIDDLQRELEERVFQRTNELQRSNKSLLIEISEREKIQTELMNTESFFNLILENIPNMIFVKNANDFTFTFINRAGEELTGFKKEELIGKTVNDIYPIEKAEYYNENDHKLLMMDKPIELFEEIIYTKDNNEKIFNTRKILVKNDDGEPMHIIGISGDITDQYLTKNELKNSELRFSKIFNASPIPITVCRADDHTLIDANSSYLDLLGYKREELVGRNISDIGIWKNSEMRERIIDDVIKNGTLSNIEIELLTKTGDRKITLMSFDFINLNKEALIICMGLDITNRKQIDNELRNALEKQKELNMLRTQFISMISHEFRTPLTSIMLSTDLLKRYSDNWDEDEKDKHYKRIQDTILKMTQLMENVLLIGRMDSGRFQFSADKIDFYSFLSSTANNIEFNTGNKYHIEIDYDESFDEVYIDENLVGLIITNLLTNAVKYSSSSNKILLKVEAHDKRTATISIIDHGIGIPENELHHLFKSFYRASNVGSTAGYGLGLHIVKKCVEAHNGVIEVESEVGKGTKFTVTIPIEKPEEGHFDLDL